MNNQTSPAVFEDYRIRRVYDDASETWYFSVVDIIQVLIQQPDYQAARNYWKVLKSRLKKEGSQTVTKCNRLKMTAEDGKQRLTDTADAETSITEETRNRLTDYWQKRVVADIATTAKVKRGPG